MLSSMTGYGTGSASREGITVAVEVRTVNHRFLDLHVRLAREFAALESEIQQMVRTCLQRGRVDISVTVETQGALRFSFNRNAIRGYLDSVRKLQEEFQFADTLDLKTVLGLPGVLQDCAGEPDSVPGDGVGNLLKESLGDALKGVLKMRQQEGETLRGGLNGNVQSLRTKTGAVEALVPVSVEEYKRKFEHRMSQLLTPGSLDPQRLAQEVAVLVDRSDISEELARLASHLDQFEHLLDAATEVGKKLDFLLQEMQREVNTLLSKTGNLEITQLGVAMKAEIEKMREQVQNVE